MQMFGATLAASLVLHAQASGNMNGKYAVSTGGSGSDWADWNDDYASKGYEYVSQPKKKNYYQERASERERASEHPVQPPCQGILTQVAHTQNICSEAAPSAIHAFLKKR